MPAIVENRIALPILAPLDTWLDDLAADVPRGLGGSGNRARFRSRR